METKQVNSTVIVRTFVVRRALTGLPLGKNILAHSALLVLLRCGIFFVLERLDGRSRIRCERVTFEVTKTHQYHEEIILDGLSWTKQRYGQSVSTPRTVDETRDFFLDYVQQFPYDSRFKNCHIAQEDIRRWLGLTVPEATTTTKVANWIASWIPLAAINSSGGGDEQHEKV